MRKILLLLCGLLPLWAMGQTPLPKTEFRASWVATVYGLDWPKTKSNPDAQKQELRALMDLLVSTNQNAMLLQVRTEADALYASSKEPWSRVLTGTQGQDPGYDPLAFAVEEAHKRGLELHVWLNPYRLNAKLNETAYAASHPVNTHPEWVLSFAHGQHILNPGIPAVTDYIASVVEDIVKGYDIDGVHFDDYFYPYPNSGATPSFAGITTEDAATFQQYGGSFTDVKAWRRDNINGMVRKVHDRIKALKPHVRFGMSPFGIWKNGVPAGIVGLDAYSTIYCDALSWLEGKYVDYIAPQLYWKIGGSQDYSKLLPWWAGYAQQAGRHVYAGHSLADISASARVGVPDSLRHLHELRMLSQEQGAGFRLMAQSVTEVPNQIEINRQNRSKNALGSVFYRISNLASNPAGFTTQLAAGAYARKALPPAMGWATEALPAAPSTLKAQKDGQTGDYTFSWQDGSALTFKRYVLYRSAEASMSGTDKAEAVQALLVAAETKVALSALPYGKSYWAVSLLDRYGRETPLSNVVEVDRPMQLPGAVQVTQPTQAQTDITGDWTMVRWNEATDTQSYHYQLATSAGFELPSMHAEDTQVQATSKVLNGLMPGSSYYFRVRARNQQGYGLWSATYTIRVKETVTGLDEVLQGGKALLLPNPQQAGGQLQLQLSPLQTGTWQLALLDVQGRRLRNWQQHLQAGLQRWNLSTEGLRPGLYFLQLELPGVGRQTLRLLLR